MNDLELLLKDALNEHIDTALRERRPAPPFVPPARPSERGPGKPRWIYPLLAAAAVVLLAFGVAFAGGVFTSNSAPPATEVPSSQPRSSQVPSTRPPTTPSAPSTPAADTTFDLLYPVTADGRPAAGFTAADVNGKVTDCGSLSDPSPVSYNSGVFTCGSRFQACWPEAKAGYLLCLEYPTDKILQRKRASGALSGGPGAATLPFSLTFADGTQCLHAYSLGSNPKYRSRPGQQVAYLCGGSDAVWAPTQGSVLDQSQGAFTVQVGSFDPAQPLRTAVVKTAVYAGSAVQQPKAGIGPTPTTLTVGNAKLPAPAGWRASREDNRAVPDAWCVAADPTPECRDGVVLLALAHSSQDILDLHSDYGTIGDLPQCWHDSDVRTGTRIFGGRTANWRRALIAGCGKPLDIERYVVGGTPAFVLFTESTDGAVHDALTTMAQGSVLPK
jgi:hypothetical protein